MAWIEAKPGQPIEIPIGEKVRLACCDCGLVHDFMIERRGLNLTIAFTRNRKSTNRRRKSQPKKEKHL